ncbi:splicing factor, CC1-like protein [Auriscalpium vulgare]|uniref:Splicing factor, CC1-like protein n=1 Tax=Auriscalpium vulgare TaxID=40419 RepID=A0ACB8S8P0_9AGAM|nr:splicing factor, CC1-like protein [Auriscalpium vulgare]
MSEHSAAVAEKQADARSDHSSDTLRTRRSHRSTSRDRDRRERRRERDPGDRRKSSRSRERGGRDRRSRSRDRSHRDRDRERDRDRDRRHRDRDDSHHSHRDREREDRDRRRRRRDDDVEDPDQEERSKRKRPDDSMDDGLPPPPTSAGLPRPPNLRDSPRRGSDRGHSREREHRLPRSARDPRDEFDDPPRYRRDRDGRDDRRRSIDGEARGFKSPPPPIKRPSPTYEIPSVDPMDDEPKEDDSEARSVFVSQLAARLTARDLGYFFEDKLGENTVLDARIVTDRLSRRSKGIGYVEFRSIELVDKAIGLSGTVVMGLPIMVQLTEAERNRLHPGDGNLNLPPGVSAPHGAMQLYVGSLHFNLTESDIRQVFEPFGELEFVDLHKDPTTGRSKGYAFVQYKRSEDARMALEQMEGFELAGRTLRVNTVHEKGTTKYTQQDSLDEAGGGNLNAASRQALMQKLARTEPTFKPEPIHKPNIPQAMESRSVLLGNMFDPEEETEPDWDRDLADDVKGECEEKYGSVERIKVEKESQGEIYVKFGTVDAARQAIQGLNGRWFGGKPVSAVFISDAIMQAH